MTNEELKQLLYEKMLAEQEWYRQRLLGLPPQEILNHTYEYTVREDILMALESCDLSAEQARALLRSPTPLADVFKDWSRRESTEMQEMQETIQARADQWRKRRPVQPDKHRPEREPR